jgi:hypothetical protein
LRNVMRNAFSRSSFFMMCRAWFSIPGFIHSYRLIDSRGYSYLGLTPSLVFPLQLMTQTWVNATSLHNI